MDKKEDLPISKILTQKEIRRYSLQIQSPQIGLKGQERLKESKVLVVGAGGKGTAVLENLVAAGVGKIGISDNSPVEEYELSRQHLYGNGDLGKQKAIIAREKLHEINHFVEIQLHNVYLTEKNIFKIAAPYDLIIDTTDNFQAHCLINNMALSTDKPFVFGEVNKSFAAVSVFNYKEGPSFLCLYPEENSMKKINPSDGFSCQITLISLIGAIIANEALKILQGFDTQLNGELLIIESNTYSTRHMSILKKPENFKI